MELTKEQMEKAKKEIEEMIEKAEDKEQFLIDLINEVYSKEENND
jgi:hypothetical protein